MPRTLRKRRVDQNTHSNSPLNLENYVPQSPITTPQASSSQIFDDVSQENDFQDKVSNENELQRKTEYYQRYREDNLIIKERNNRRCRLKNDLYDKNGNLIYSTSKVLSYSSWRNLNSKKSLKLNLKEDLIDVSTPSMVETPEQINEKVIDKKDLAEKKKKKD